MENKRIKIFEDGVIEFTKSTDEQLKNKRYHRGDLFLTKTMKHVPLGSQILDYGCGPGRISILLANKGYNVIGVDPVAKYIETSNNYKNNQNIKSAKFLNLIDFHFANNCYDAIVCSSVIEFIEKPSELLMNFFNSLTINGTLIISFSNKLSFFRKYAELKRNKKLFPVREYQLLWTEKEFVNLCRSNGFEKVEKADYFEPNHLNTKYLGTLGIMVFRKNG
jgi:2-polyprenyl-3-methyl-5-hydroxy-6-metoxy-1,4-benzoquinol methylase